MNNKKIAYALSALLIILSLTACNGKGDLENPNIELGEIKTPEVTEDKPIEPDKVVKLDPASIKVNADKKDEDKLHGGGWLINDSGRIKNLVFETEGKVTDFITGKTMLMYKTEDNQIYSYDLREGGHRLIASDEEIYTPYKFGASGTTVLSINFDKDNYKVLSGSNVYTIEKSNRDLIMSDNQYAYMFKNGKFERYNLKEKSYEEINVMINGKKADVKNMYDRFDSDLIEVFTGNTIYLINPEIISNGKVELTDKNKIEIDDIKEIFKDNSVNGSNQFVYLSTDGQIKTYNRYTKSISLEMPDIITSRLENNPQAFVIEGAAGANMIYFTDLYKAYRYEPGKEVLFEVDIKPLSRLQSMETYVLNLDDTTGTIVYTLAMSVSP